MFNNILGTYFKSETLGLPWWLNGEESSCRCRRQGFDPWSRKTPHAVEQLSLCITTTEPLFSSPRTATTEPTCRNYSSLNAPEPVLRSKRRHSREQPLPHNCRIAPLAATREETVQR